MKREELDEILRLHKLWIAGEDGGDMAVLSGADLSGSDLEGANLRVANLYGANLYGANLREAILQGSSLRGANLDGANLEGANLRMASLRGAHLEGANLEGANLQGADLEGADLEGASLRGADIDYASWPLWCGSLNVKIDARIAAQLVYHCVRACQSVKDDEDVVSFCNDPVVIKLANRFHRVDECGRIEAAEGGAK